MLVFNAIVMVLGLAASILLFFRFPVLPKKRFFSSARVSVIIPARNEEFNLPGLLTDLAAQRRPADEIIVVDDGSADGTARLASAMGVRVISITDKPAGWNGKSFACQTGAQASTGDWLLFLDADVRLHPDAIESLLAAASGTVNVVSVQPYHQLLKPYEHLSLFFNLIQAGANGLTAVGHPQHIGLFGPLILISQSIYRSIGGHEGVCSELIEDLALGTRLNRSHIPYLLYLGNGTVAYRMYPAGIRLLSQGWIKNVAIGALKTKLPLFAAVFGLILACATPLLYGSIALFQGDWIGVMVYAAFYLAWVVELARVSRRLGNFRWWSIAMYPLPLLYFLGIFCLSFFRRLFRLPVVWKNRKISQGGKK
ncbi:MAG: hypothetical protein A2Y16_05935 [Tenericutes bacterium GWF2_57_13]|nr:MAG: hypothetical protein A2Y16_05935 [Tenericutes bacterium GWF2_57_13]